MSDDDLPESYHVAVLAGIRFLVSEETRKEIEWFVAKGAPNEILTVETICHEEVGVVHGHVQLLYSTTPESRRTEALMQKRADSEEEFL